MDPTWSAQAAHAGSCSRFWRWNVSKWLPCRLGLWVSRLRSLSLSACSGRPGCPASSQQAAAAVRRGNEPAAAVSCTRKQAHRSRPDHDILRYTEIDPGRWIVSADTLYSGITLAYAPGSLGSKDCWVHTARPASCQLTAAHAIS